MAATYFRVQGADRDASELLDPGYQFSHAWAGRHDREGVSVCESLDDLALYLASHLGMGIPVQVDTWVIVEVEADLIPDASPVDSEFELLVRPTAVVSVNPVDDRFIEMIAAASALLSSFTDQNLED